MEEIKFVLPVEFTIKNYPDADRLDLKELKDHLKNEVFDLINYALCDKSWSSEIYSFEDFEILD